ncbi:MAG: 50S ribosomal protein L4 [Candidatus Omnitrophica bacterium]|nr:50S ribosomal protein L4 [Candidatus Omnitrophota bacterium]
MTTNENIKYIKLSLDGKRSEGDSLPESLQKVEVSEHILYQVEVNYQANNRQGTLKTKDRSEVSGGGKKPWKQKGTGRARVGSNRSPLWRGGGTTFGPVPRDFSYDLPKKLRNKALLVSLKKKAIDGKLFLLDADFEIKSGKTKDLAATVTKFKMNKPLFINSKSADETVRAQRNIKKVSVKSSAGVCVHDILLADECVVSAQSIADVLKRAKA